MAEAHGKSGSITLSGLTAGVHSWEISYDADTVESTDFADAGVKTYVLGGKGWSGSMEANWDAANTAHAGDAAASLTLTAASGDTYAGSAILTNETVKVTKDDINRVSYKFQGTGALTITL